jgi:hypothetical protein
VKKLITILTFINSVALAQDFQGYVILNSGDTLRGQIKPYEDAYDILMYTEVRFFKDGEKIKFTPKEIKEYHVATQNYSETYVTKDIGKRSPQLIFFKVLVRGYCTLYESHRYSDRMINNMRVVEPPSFYLQREGEELHLAVFPYLTSGKDLYFI